MGCIRKTRVKVASMLFWPEQLEGWCCHLLRMEKTAGRNRCLYSLGCVYVCVRERMCVCAEGGNQKVWF